MLQRKFEIFVIPLLVLGISNLNGQNGIQTTGGNASGGGGSVSYTVGQVFYLQNTGTDGFEAQGVQQPYEISVLTSYKEAEDILLEFLIYPNPASDYLILKIKGETAPCYNASLLDLKGNFLQIQKIETNETLFSMQNYPAGTYLIKIFQVSLKTSPQKAIKTFKITKY